MPNIDSITIDGRKIEINYNTKSDHFEAVVEGDLHRSDTKRGLIDNLKAALRTAKARLNLPITIIDVESTKSKWSNEKSWQDGIGLRDVTVTGVHQQNGDLLIEDGGKKERKRAQSWSSDGTVCRRLTAAQKDEYLKLARTLDTATKAKEAFTERHKIENVNEWVRKELAVAVDQVKEPEVEETGDPRTDPAPKKKKAR